MTSPPIAALIASTIALRGYRRQSLSRGGALAAAFVGYVHWVCGTRFGLPLILFYLSSSKLTHWRSDEKARLEAGHKEGGQRKASQVFANSLGGLLLALAARHGAPTLWQPSSGAAAFFLAAFLGHYASCTADTWASEVGILSKQPPRLITTLQVTKPGVNGGVSPLGFGAGLAGGLFIGAASWVLEVVAPSFIAGAVSPGSGSSRFSGFSPGNFGPWNLLLGMLGGAAGNSIDSLLGATLQFSGLDFHTGKVVSAPGQGVKRICGRDVLSNDAVNLLSAAAAAVLTGLIAWHWT